jgi:hypothetical protein
MSFWLSCAPIAEIRSRLRGPNSIGPQAHCVRGFLSTAAKKHSLKIESRKTETGDRVCQVKK